jgi:hypothetical protein
VTWEAVICAGLSVGLIVLFREMLHRPRRPLVAMASASYAAYILNVYIVVGLQAGIEGRQLPAMVKFAPVAVLGGGPGLRHRASVAQGARRQGHPGHHPRTTRPNRAFGVTTVTSWTCGMRALCVFKVAMDLDVGAAR